MKPVRVLLVAPSLQILGGQSVQATRLLRELRKRSEITIDFQPINPDFPAPLRWVKKIPFARTALTFAMYNLQMLLRVPRYDLIHTFSAGLSSYALWTVPAVLMSRLFGRKFILNYRDGQIEQHLREWRVAAPTIRMADAIVSPSEYVVAVLANQGITAQTIFNVIDMTPFRFRARKKLRPVFMTNRILEPLYNVGCVLRAFAIVQRKYPEASLKVAHDGVCRPSLEALARQLGLRNTEFVGRVPHNNVPDLYDEADIYLTSPNIDCMPGSLLECYATGLPLIATRTGGIPYLVRDGETGLLVECNDHEAMAACALRLLEDEHLVEKLTRQGFEELAKYDWVKGEIGQKWMSLYLQLAGRM